MGSIPWTCPSLLAKNVLWDPVLLSQVLFSAESVHGHHIVLLLLQPGSEAPRLCPDCWFLPHKTWKIQVFWNLESVKHFPFFYWPFLTDSKSASELTEKTSPHKSLWVSHVAEAVPWLWACSRERRAYGHATGVQTRHHSNTKPLYIFCQYFHIFRRLIWTKLILS